MNAKVLRYPAVILCILLTAFITKLSAQEDQDSIKKMNRNVSFMELGGNGLLLSFNYERFLNEDIGIRIGAGIPPGFSFPLMLNYYVGKRHKLELGVGLVFGVFAVGFGDLAGVFTYRIPTATIGYRYQTSGGGKGKGSMFRISFTPLYLNNFEGKHFKPYVGLSLGNTF